MVASMSLESPTAGESQPLLQPKQLHETLVTIDDSLDPQTRNLLHDAGKELKTLLTLVYPVVVTTALEFLPGFTCIILTGHIQSPHVQQYVDAATLSTMFINLSAYSVGFGLTSALDTLCSQAYGANRLDKIGIYFQTGLLVILACLGPVFLVNWYSETFLLYLGQDPEVSRLAQLYSRWVLLGMPFVFLYELMRKVLQAQNIMKPLISITIGGNVVSIVSGYWLTYHTSMGFEGAALSRSLSNMVLPLLLLPYFSYHPQHFTQWWRGWKIKEAVDHVGLFLRLGVPGMLMMLLEWWAFELLTLLSGLLPNAVVSVSAHAVTCNVENLIYMVYAGLGVAANIRVGNCLGANDPSQAKLACTVASTLTLVVALSFSISLFVLRNSIPGLFLDSLESIQRAATVLVVWAPFVVVDGLNTVMLGVFRGAGKQKVAATVNAVAYYVFGIPVAGTAAFHYFLGVEGLWLGFGTGILVSATSLLLMSRHWSWTQLADDAQKRMEQ